MDPVDPVNPDYVPGYNPSMYDMEYNLPCDQPDYSPCDYGGGGGSGGVVTTCTPESCRQKCLDHMGLDIGECFGDKCYCKERYL